MSEVVTVTEPAQVAPEIQNFFDTDKWKSEPTVIEPAAVSKDPAIDEKDKKIEETKPEITAPNQPENTPTASPKPIQDRPEEDKKNIKPAEEVKKPETEALKFANEESEKVFNLIKEGKIDDVLSILSEQKMLKEVDKMPPADVIKLNLQYQHKEFTPAEIQDLFEETYSLPDKPIQSLSEDDDDFKIRQDKYDADVKKIESRIARDAKPAIAELAKLSKEIVLPDIQRSNQAQPEPTQEELEALKLQKETFLKHVDAIAKTFNGYSATFKDKEVEIPVAYTVTDEERDAIKPLVEAANFNAGEFMKQIGWVNAEGQVDNAKLLEDLHLLKNKENIFSRLISETGNKRHEASIKSIKNIDYSGGKNGQPDLGLTPEKAQQALADAIFV